MKIIYKEEALNDLQKIQNYIAEMDSVTKAKKFIQEIRKSIKNLSYMPFKFRKSYFADDDSIRDFIYKGYTIVYKVEKETIIILTIFRQRNFTS